MSMGAAHYVLYFALFVLFCEPQGNVGGKDPALDFMLEYIAINCSWRRTLHWYPVVRVSLTIQSLGYKI
jgi:hypothetical protein